MEELDGEDESYEDELDSDQDLDSELNDNFDVDAVNKASDDSEKNPDEIDLGGGSDNEEAEAETENISGKDPASGALDTTIQGD